MKIRIKHATDDNWYKVGEEYEVEDEVTVDSLTGLRYHVQKGETFIGVGEDDLEIVEKYKETPVSIDAHYNFNYNLTKKEMDQGFIKVDPYFVAKQWKLGEKDNSGIIFHCLKTLARYSEKNTKEREINALYKQVKRLAELEGVELK